MAWTIPRTWTTGELVTAAIMNTHIRDNQNVLNPAGVSFVIDGGGAAITTGSKMYWSVPFDCTVARYDLYTDAASGLKIELYGDTYANFPPTAGDSYNSGSPASTASARKGQDTNPSAWGALTEGDGVIIYVTGASGPTIATLTLYLART